jgi:hypothetical protein
MSESGQEREQPGGVAAGLTLNLVRLVSVSERPDGQEESMKCAGPAKTT